MRRFIVTNPNLNVGRPGSVVTADELNMPDEKLDEWVAAGLGMEIENGGDADEHVPGTFARLEGGTFETSHPELFDDGTDHPLPLTVVLYDPTNHTVADVLAHVERYPDQATDVLTREIEGRNRAGIVNVLGA